MALQVNNDIISVQAVELDCGSVLIRMASYARRIVVLGSSCTAGLGAAPGFLVLQRKGQESLFLSSHVDAYENLFGIDHMEMEVQRTVDADLGVADSLVGLLERFLTILQRNCSIVASIVFSLLLGDSGTIPVGKKNFCDEADNGCGHTRPHYICPSNLRSLLLLLSLQLRGDIIIYATLSLQLISEP